MKRFALRRWRVARQAPRELGSYASPPVRFLTRAGAAAAARDLNALEGYRSGFLVALQGGSTARWAPIRNRVLRSIQSHNLLEERRQQMKSDYVGSVQRHPAGRKKVLVPTQNLCTITGECAGPWAQDGHCVHCRKLTADGVAQAEEIKDDAPKSKPEPKSQP